MTTATSAVQPATTIDPSKIRLDRRPSSDLRTIDEICHHYIVERELSNRLRTAKQEQRRDLYCQLYDEVCQRVPNIPGWNVPIPAESLRRNLADKVCFLKHFASRDCTFLEVGPGDCSLSLAMTKEVGQVIAVDVSTEITRSIHPPDNFRLLISDGTSIDLPPESVDLAYSNQVMEHLHPEDAAEQLRNIYRVLKPGGRYICITPSKLSGPHDVSKYFDDEPTGFHLKEYSTGELAAVFRIAGFQEIYPFLWIKQRLILLPLAIVSFLEGRLSKLTRTTRYRLCNRAPLNHLLGRVVAVRPCK